MDSTGIEVDGSTATDPSKVIECPNIPEAASEEASVENGHGSDQDDTAADSVDDDGSENPLESAGVGDSDNTGSNNGDFLNSVESCEDSENSGFPSIMCAETISEDAFEEDEQTDELTKTKEDDGGDKSATEVSEELPTDEKEQEPVNESSETDKKDAEETEKESPVKQEPALFADYDGDQPNEDPNTEEAADSDQEMDPEIAAAMEASLLETEAMDEEEAASASTTPGNSKFIFRNETEVDSAAEDSAEVDSLDNGALGSLTEEDIELAGEAVTAEMEIGSTEIGGGYNPLEAGDSNPLDEPGDYDPFDEDGAGIAVDEDTNGFLDKVNSGFMTQIHSFPEHEANRSTRGPRGPYKKTREKYADADFDPLSGPAPRVRPSRAKGQLSCNICHFPFEVIGELKLHKYTDHENQPKPSYLDLTEVAIGKLSTKNGGASQIKILKEITNDPMTTDTTSKAKLILSKALKFGVEKGRLRLGKPGKTTQRYYLAKKGVRKAAHDKFNRNKKLVEFDEAVFRNPPPKLKPKPKASGPSSSELRNLLPSHISITPVSSGPSQAGHISQPDPKKFGRGKRTGPAASGGGDQIGMKRSPSGVKRKAMPIGEITLDSDSDDDIAIISEKITKPKKKITIVRVAPGKGKQTPIGKKLPSSMVKVGSASKAKTVSSGQVRKPAPVEKVDDDDDDEDFSCRVCQAVFWFKGQLVDHLKNTHNVDNPDKYLKTK